MPACRLVLTAMKKIERIIGEFSIANDTKGKLSEWYDELLAKTDIIKLISNYVPLKKKGNTHWGCCPFHLEKTPSFSVTESKQLYHCFGCKESGNAITFVKKIESIESFEAAKILAQSAGMEVPVFSSNQDKNSDEEFAAKRSRLYSLMREAAKHYHENLVSGKSRNASEYLQKREIDSSLITKFGLGYSLGGNAVIEHLKKSGYSEQEMKDAGLIEISANGAYDVFYDRLIIPIINNFKEVVAFGGRTLQPNPEFAKYRNSSQTPIFDKSKNIYGINLLKAKKLQDRNIEYIIMCEGYMDVITLHKAGFDTAVASMGTALTFAQSKLLKNYCNKVYISYDGDSAGQKATLRGLDILAEAGLNVKVVSLPEGLDPDDVIKKYGKQTYEKLLIQAQTLPAFKINALKKEYDLNLADEKSKFAVEAVKVIKALSNPVEMEEYLRIIQKLTNYSMSALLAQAGIAEADAAIEQIAPKSENTMQTGAVNKSESAKMFVLTALANGCGYIDYTENFSSILDDPLYNELAEFFIKCRLNGGKSVSTVYNAFGDEYKEKLDKILYYEFLAGDNEQKYKNCVTTLKIDTLQKQKEELAQNWNKTKDIQLINEIKKIDIQLKELKNAEI